MIKKIIGISIITFLSSINMYGGDRINSERIDNRKNIEPKHINSHKIPNRKDIKPDRVGKVIDRHKKNPKDRSRLEYKNNRHANYRPNVTPPGMMPPDITPPSKQLKVTRKHRKDDKELVYHNKHKSTSTKNIHNKNSKEPEDKVEKLLMVIQMMSEEEKKMKEEEIKKKKMTSASKIFFTPLKSIRIGNQIFVDVEISFEKSTLKKAFNTAVNSINKTNTPPPPGKNSKPGKPKPVKPTTTVETEKVPAQIYTLTVGDQIDDWKVTKATDRMIIFTNIKNKKEIKKYY